MDGGLELTWPSHGKAEDLAVFMQSLFFAGSGLFIAAIGLKRLFIPQSISYGNVGVIIMIFSTIITTILIYFQINIKFYLTMLN